MEKLTRQQAFSLSVDAYYGKSSVEDYSAEERNKGFVEYLADLNKDYKRNKLEIFEIIEDTVNEILPAKVNDAVKQFAEFRDFPNNTTCKFKVKNGKVKAVNVALGGTVKRVRIDQGSFLMSTEAVQAKVYEEYERVIGGLVDWNALIDLVVEAVNDAILLKIYQALIGIYASLPAANKHSNAGLEVAELDKIISLVKAYGKPVIMGTPLGVASIPLDSYSSEVDKMDVRNKGFIGMHKGCPVIELPNSFEDTDNAVKTFSDQYLFVIPSGGEKIVKVGLEGGLVTRESNGQDWTVNFEAYQKVGVAVVAINNIGIFDNTSLA
jgi:hypothetical protein